MTAVLICVIATFVAYEIVCYILYWELPLRNFQDYEEGTDDQ